MKAEVIHEYGGPEVMKFESIADPEPGLGEILIRVVATSVNPVDWKRRSGEAKSAFPLHFPDIVGADVSGTVEKIGSNVSGFQIGDRVFAMAQKTYAEFCVVKAIAVAKIPEGVDIVEAARIPLVATTGHLAAAATNLKAGATVVITGATGSVGRAAVFTAQEMGLTIIAAVRKEHLKDAEKLGVSRVVTTDDASLESLEQVDGVIDLISGPSAEILIAKVKAGGVMTTVLQPPKNAKQFPLVQAFRVQAQADRKTLVHMAKALQEGKFEIPIEATYKMSEAGRAQAEAEEGGVGKIILVN